MSEISMLETICEAILKKQGRDGVIIDFHGQSILCDYFVIASGDSNRQIEALVDSVQETLEKQFPGHCRIQGTSDSGWVILDAKDVIVHIFSREMRDFFQLEKLYLQYETRAFTKDDDESVSAV
ncbi:MAG: ribosome silencing factor [Erysipelotrichaceae bacterium]|jgi:ribosome-associated protein|nr:ribosome silencing factor [Erysipelotrichaceae bacterium]